MILASWHPVLLLPFTLSSNTLTGDQPGPTSPAATTRRARRPRPTPGQLVRVTWEDAVSDHDAPLPDIRKPAALRTSYGVVQAANRSRLLLVSESTHMARTEGDPCYDWTMIPMPLIRGIEVLGEVTP